VQPSILGNKTVEGNTNVANELHQFLIGSCFQLLQRFWQQLTKCAAVLLLSALCFSARQWTQCVCHIFPTPSHDTCYQCLVTNTAPSADNSSQRKLFY